MSLSLNLKPLFIFMVFIWLDFFYLETIRSELYHDLMTSIWEKVISILMGNLNSSRSYLLAAVLINLPERNDIGHCTLMFDVLSHTGWILGQTLGINQTVEFNFCCVKCHSHVIWIAWDTNVFYNIFCKKRRKGEIISNISSRNKRIYINDRELLIWGLRNIGIPNVWDSKLLSFLKHA